MNPLLLDIDVEMERVIEADDPAAAQAVLAALIAADERRALWGLARAVQREVAVERRLGREMDAIRDEYARRMVVAQNRAMLLGGYIEDIVKARRERGEGNSVDLPGIGQWSTRSVKAGWDVASSAAADGAVMEFLHANDADAAYEIIEDKPTIKRDQLRAWLDSLDDESAVPVIEALGEYIQRRPERISVSFKAAL